MFLLKLAFRPWKLAPLSQIFSSLAVGFLLMMIGFLFWIQKALDPVLSRLEHEQVITAYIAPEQTDQARIVDSIRLTLGAHPEAAARQVDIQLVEGAEFISEVKTRYPDLANQLEELGPEMGTIVPRYVSIAGYLSDSVLEQIRAVPGVEGAESSKDQKKPILAAFRAVRWITRFLALGIAAALLTGLVQLSRMNSYFHRDSLALLRLWGAGEWSLRVPALLSALWVGACGGVIGASSWLLAQSWLSSQVRALSPLLAQMKLASPLLAASLLGVGIGLGALAGILSSHIGNIGSRQA